MTPLVDIRVSTELELLRADARRNMKGRRPDRVRIAVDEEVETIRRLIEENGSTTVVYRGNRAAVEADCGANSLRTRHKLRYPNERWRINQLRDGDDAVLVIRRR